MDYKRKLTNKYETDVFVAGGGAAGVGAALACETGDTRSIDIKKLQENLKKLGAYLPNA